MYYAQLTLAEVDQEIKNGSGTKEQSSHRDYKHEDAKREDFIRESIAAKMWIITLCNFSTTCSLQLGQFFNGSIIYYSLLGCVLSDIKKK